jgi:hypothetical protein
MRVERLSKSWLLRYERGSVLLFGRNAYAIQAGITRHGGAVQLARACARLVEGKLIYPDRPPLEKNIARDRFFKVMKS